MEENDDIRGFILGTIHDLVANFLYYDRKNDEELRVGDIEKAIASGQITIEEIIEQFSVELRGGLYE